MGVVVLMLAIVCTLGVAWVMSMDVNEVEVTKYASLVDITDQFETEKSPEYITYNPSTNYTGYYTDDSVIGNDKYFDGVEYSTSNPNNYRLNLAPSNYQTGSKDLTTLNDISSDYYIQFVEYFQDAGRTYVKTVYEDGVVELSSIVSNITNGDFDLLVLKSPGNYDISGMVIDGVSNVDCCFFVIKSDVINSRYLDLGSESAVIEHGWGSNYGYIVPCVSATVDKRTNSVNLYYDNAQQNPRGVYTFDDVLVVFSQSDNPNPSNNLAMVLANSLDYTTYTFPDPEYMDPSKGVSL